MARTHPRARAMIRWLADKDPDVWFATTPLLNWDNALPVLQWIVSQPGCDRANAAAIFWAGSPGYFARQRARGEPMRSDSWPLLETVLENWNKDLYQRSELAWPDAGAQAAMARYERETVEEPGMREALPVPQGLFGPFPGRAPRVPRSLTPRENAELWDLLAGLGTHAGFRPGSEDWKADKAARTERDLGQAKRRRQKYAAAFWLSLSLALFVLAAAIALRP